MQHAEESVGSGGAASRSEAAAARRRVGTTTEGAPPSSPGRRVASGCRNDGAASHGEVLRDALAGGAGREGLRGATVVFIPVVNVDGHAFGPCQRPNQR
jgi:hypothetical protein